MSANIRFLYDQLLESLVRLKSYDRWVVDETRDDLGYDIDVTAFDLFRRDLLIYAANIRNFSEATESTAALRNFNIPMYEVVSPPAEPHFRKLPNNPSINLYQLSSRILHSIETDIFNDGRYIPALASFRDLYLDYTAMEKFRLSGSNYGTIILTRTNKKEIALNKLHDINKSSFAYLQPVVERLGDERKLMTKSMREFLE